MVFRLGRIRVGYEFAVGGIVFGDVVVVIIVWGGIVG